MQVDVITHPSGEQIPILLDRDGLPIPSPNEFILGRRALSSNTLTRNLRELAVFYRWLEQQNIDLRDRIQTGRGFSEAEVRGGIVEALRLEQGGTSSIHRSAVSPHTFNQRLTTVRQYVAWRYDMYLGALPLSDLRYERIREQSVRILKWLDSAFMSAPPQNKGVRKGLTDKEAKFLIDCLDPDRPDPIGRDPAVRFRNYISTMIMLYYGLRPGELLTLRVEDIEIGAISCIRVRRRPPDLKDTRRPRPQIKRNGRILPIDDPSFASKLDRYIMKWRDILESKSENESDYLILSDEGTPLSQSSLTQLYQILRNQFSNDLPEHLSAKALRHTFSSRIERALREAGVDEERRRQALALLRGDSSLESQTVYIAQEVEEQANLALKKFQQKLLS
ncbi:MAG TPA: site-specific integrase [Oligoflexus sp.]|uniref:tyrosine-type recombinase/integrase n=1 Tax=Oligoflexus sp. TaxID=1971216 RepID=UPI002D7F6AD7|nr:site-specific integrase [Oligoflexus sp.]HET9241397.1 site-specific integrase [Oligoflexus sp.]